MGPARYLVGLLCLGTLAGCNTASTSDRRGNPVDLESEENTNLPPPPPNSTCALIQRGTLGDAQDLDVGYGDGPNVTTGAMTYSWTGVSPYDHWSAYQFDLGPVPANANIVLGVFSSYVQWNEASADVRLHRIVGPWNEATATWSSFTSDGTQTNWDPAVLGSFAGEGVGFRSVDVTGLVQQWHSGAVANNGVLLEEDPILLHSYFTSEAIPTNIRPSLYVCWVDGAPPACGQSGSACAGLMDCCDGLACQNGTCKPIGPPDGDGDGVPSNLDCDDENPLIGALLYENDMSVDTSYLANGPKLTDPWQYHDGAVSPTKGGQQALLGQAEGWTDTVSFLTLSAHGSLSGCSSDAPDCQPDRFRAGMLSRQIVAPSQDEGYAGYRCAVAQNSATDCYEPGPFVQLAAFLQGPEDNIHSECTAGCPPNPTFDQLGRKNRSDVTDLLSGGTAKLTFWVVGSQLECTFDGVGGEHVTTSAVDDRFASGGTGLSTLNALGDFDHLKVCQAFGTPGGGAGGGSGGGSGGAGGSTATGTDTGTGTGGAGGDTGTVTVTDTGTGTVTATDTGTVTATDTGTGTGTDTITATGPQCNAVGAACGDNVDCCDGACFDGLCIATNQCLPPDSLTVCDPTNPCCGGAHCVVGLCWNDAVCKAPGAACDPNNDACCWGLDCTDGTCQ